MPEKHADLQCTLICEHLSATGEVTKRTIKRDALLVVGRNQFGEILLQAEVNSAAPLSLDVRKVTVHKKFINEGKATIKSSDSHIQLMISNCPPNILNNFLRMVSIKLAAADSGNAAAHQKLTARQRLLSELPKSFTEISPLTANDVQNAEARRRMSNTDTVDSKPARKALSGTTPTGKRKHNSTEDKENIGAKKPCMLRRKLCGSPQVANRPNSTNNSGKSNVIGPCQLSIKSLLTNEQERVLSAVLSGRSLFFTGSAGSGKSHLLKRIIGSLPPEHTYVTASTGVAACHIGGTTLHAFSGIGSGTAELPRCIELASRPVVLQQWKHCRHLIIDEISMVDGRLFDKLEAVARQVRKTDKPFGGIQVIVCGDFLQLPPVTKLGEKRVYAFQSAGWRRTIGCYLELKTVHRQSDQEFIHILQNVRVGRCTEAMENKLRETSRHTVDTEGIVATRLCTHKDDVEMINSTQLQLIKNCAGKTYKALDSTPTQSALLDSLCPVKSSIHLKVGAQVMLTKNLDVQKGLVNGARGVVVDFESNGSGLPRVKFLCGQQLLIQAERWSVRGLGGAMLQRKQLPLKLAWAISIHKSQGMTLDCVEISLSRVFEAGQAYVALSRARSLQGLRVFDFDRRCIRADPEVLQFYSDISRNIES